MPDTTPSSATARKATVRRSTAGKNEPAATDPLSVQPVVAPKKQLARKASAAPAISPEERHHLIAVGAFFISERNISLGGSLSDNWVQAEKEIDAMFAAGMFAA